MLNPIFILLFALTLAPNNYELDISLKLDFKLVSFSTDDDGIIEGSFFEGPTDLAVVFAHGAVFNKESWYFLAKHLQSKGIASLSIDFRGYGNSKVGSTNNKALDVLGAVDYLKAQGFKNITLVGGSMGAAAILDALELETDINLRKVVLLAPAGGKGISNKKIEKLVVVSKDEGLFTKANQIFNESTDPKQLKIFSGSIHAQHLFNSEHRDELIDLVIEFITTK
ncbi:alpha/beta hydrolase family protein [Flavobacteriaceae bacterium MAR_2010_105]|nr:alpha/beta hydrolase family protein [Flavobacteriaceae bacterium MAR_2010_105]